MSRKLWIHFSLYRFQVRQVCFLLHWLAIHWRRETQTTTVIMDIQEVLKTYGIAQPSSDIETKATKEINPSKQVRIFVNAAVEVDVVILVQTNLPWLEGGNVVVDIDELEYNKGLVENQFSVIRRWCPRWRVETQMSAELHNILCSIWKIPRCKIIPVGRKFYHIFLKSIEEHSYVMSLGEVSVKFGVLRISKWVPDFNPITQKQVNA